MHGEKRDVEPDEEQPEMYLPEHSIQKSPGHLREPVIQTAEHGKERASDQDIMKVRHQEIGIMYLQIDRYRSQHHSRESTNKKFKEETKNPEHGQLHLQLAMPNSGQPAVLSEGTSLSASSIKKTRGLSPDNARTISLKDAT